MNNKQVNTQDVFLNQIRKEYIPVTIYLSHSIQLKGTVKCFDNFVIILESNDKKQTLIYKHAIASIVPLKYVNIEG